MFRDDIWVKEKRDIYSCLYQTYHPSTYAETFLKPSSYFDGCIMKMEPIISDGAGIGFLPFDHLNSFTWGFDTLGPEQGNDYRIGELLLQDTNYTLDWISATLVFDKLADIMEEFMCYCGENGIDPNCEGKCMGDFNGLEKDYKEIYNYVMSVKQDGAPVESLLSSPGFKLQRLTPKPNTMEEQINNFLERRLTVLDENIYTTQGDLLNDTTQHRIEHQLSNHFIIDKHIASKYLFEWSIKDLQIEHEEEIRDSRMVTNPELELGDVITIVGIPSRLTQYGVPDMLIDYVVVRIDDTHPSDLEYLLVLPENLDSFIQYRDQGFRIMDHLTRLMYDTYTWVMSDSPKKDLSEQLNAESNKELLLKHLDGMELPIRFMEENILFKLVNPTLLEDLPNLDLNNLMDNPEDTFTLIYDILYVEHEPDGMANHHFFNGRNLSNKQERKEIVKDLSENLPHWTYSIQTELFDMMGITNSEISSILIRDPQHGTLPWERKPINEGILNTFKSITNLNKGIITEGVLQDFISKFPDNEIVIDDFYTNSMTIGGSPKYLQFMVQSWVDDFDMSDNSYHLGKIVNNVKKFSDNLPKLTKENLQTIRDEQGLYTEISDKILNNPKDINSYISMDPPNFEYLMELVEDIISKRELKKIKKSGVDKLYEDDRWLLVRPNTYEGSCYYGSTTKWCTASKDAPQHFESYSKTGKLYYIIDKSKDVGDFFKIALHKKWSGEEEWYDRADNELRQETEEAIRSLLPIGLIKSLEEDHGNKPEPELDEGKFTYDEFRDKLKSYVQNTGGIQLKTESGVWDLDFLQGQWEWTGPDPRVVVYATPFSPDIEDWGLEIYADYKVVDGNEMEIDMHIPHHQLTDPRLTPETYLDKDPPENYQNGISNVEGNLKRFLMHIYLPKVKEVLNNPELVEFIGGEYKTEKPINEDILNTFKSITNFNKGIITEGRVEDVYKKYFTDSTSTFLTDVYRYEIVPGSAEINPNHKYLEWITGRLETGGRVVGGIEHNLKEILLAVSKFDNQSQRLEIKDINQYKDIDQLFDALKKVGETSRRTVDITDDVEKIYEDNRFVVVVPKTHAASCHYGSGTKWCVASKDTSSHFSTYKKGGELYYIIDKTLSTNSPYYKVALNKKISGLKEEFWDVKDNMITQTTDILHILQNKKMLEQIRNNFTSKYKERIEQEKELLAKRLTDQEERVERERLRRLDMQRESRHRRMADSWNPEDTDNEGTLANALREWLIDEGEWEGDTKDTVIGQIETMRSEMENDPEVIEDPNGEKAQEYGEDISNLEEELDNAESVYDIYPLNYDNYGLTGFEYEGAEYLIGTDDQADSAAREQLSSLLDDIGYEGFNESFVHSHIDGQEVANYSEDWFRDDVNESPESYLDEDEDRELTSEAEGKIARGNDLITNLRGEIEESEDEGDIEMLNNDIEELEGTIEDVKEDEDSYEWLEESIESAVTSKMSEVEQDPISFLQDYGMQDRITDFIDKDDFIDDVINSDGRGNGLSGYDGNENEVVYQEEWYYIYRIN